MISSLCVASSLAFFSFRHIKTLTKCSTKVHELQRKLIKALCAQVHFFKLYQHSDIKLWGGSSLLIRVHSFSTVSRFPIFQNIRQINLRTKRDSDYFFPCVRCYDNDPRHIGLQKRIDRNGQKRSNGGCEFRIHWVHYHQCIINVWWLLFIWRSLLSIKLLL